MPTYDEFFKKWRKISYVWLNHATLSAGLYVLPLGQESIFLRVTAMGGGFCSESFGAELNNLKRNLKRLIPDQYQKIPLAANNSTVYALAVLPYCCKQ